MSKEKSAVIRMTEDELELRLQHTHVAGKRALLATVVAMLQAAAGEEFARGRDEVARAIRELFMRFAPELQALEKDLEGHIQREYQLKKTGKRT
jgi:hypothetical protein